MDTRLSILLAGLTSHGFREDEDSPFSHYRRFRRIGREDRWVRITDSRLFIGGGNPGEWKACGSLDAPDSQILLLLKCGEIYLRTQARAAERGAGRTRRQKALFEAEEALRELGP